MWGFFRGGDLKCPRCTGFFRGKVMVSGPLGGVFLLKCFASNVLGK